MRTSRRAIRRRILFATVAAAAVLAAAAYCAAADLEKETVMAFNHYVQVAEEQMQSSLRADGPFLWIDLRPESSRKHFYERLRAGQFVIQQLDTRDDGREIEIPGGMVHHWVGLSFVPGITLKSAQGVLEDFQDYALIYAPQVRRARVFARDGDAFKLSLQLYKDSPRRVAYNADFSVRRISLSPTRIASSSTSTRIAQLQDPSQMDGPELPVDQDAGYLWRMNDYWRCEQKDGGVYIQVEAITLSREVPGFIAWLVRPIIRHVARETMADLLESDRRAMQDPARYAPHAFGDVAAPASAAPSSNLPRQ